MAGVLAPPCFVLAINTGVTDLDPAPRVVDIQTKYPNLIIDLFNICHSDCVKLISSWLLGCAILMWQVSILRAHCSYRNTSAGTHCSS